MRGGKMKMKILRRLAGRTDWGNFGRMVGRIESSTDLADCVAVQVFLRVTVGLCCVEI